MLLTPLAALLITNPPKTSFDVTNFYPGFPLPSYDQVLVKPGYLTSVSSRTRIPNWVAERITPQSRNDELSSSSSAKRPTHYKQENNITPPSVRAKNSDFKNSGYVRGHLAAVANKSEYEFKASTNTLGANIVPQNHTMNSTVWLALERFGRFLANKYENVYAVSGPLWLPKQFFSTQKDLSPPYQVTYEIIGKTMISVPTHFFKVFMFSELIHRQNMEYEKKHEYPKGAVLCFIVPNPPPDEKKKKNKNKNEETQVVFLPLEYLEFLTGLNFEAISAHMNNRSIRPYVDLVELKRLASEQGFGLSSLSLTESIVDLPHSTHHPQ